VSKRHVPHLNNAGSSSTTWRYTTYSRQPTPSRLAGWRRAAAQARHEIDLRRRYTRQSPPCTGCRPNGNAIGKANGVPAASGWGGPAKDGGRACPGDTAG
jgi:hypothetical protein